MPSDRSWAGTTSTCIRWGAIGTWWLFQDAFVDHTGVVKTFDNSRFVHNIALVQEGRCFRLLHRGSTAKPEPFETGDGRSKTRTTWWWPMGGELVDGRVWVFWAEMLKDPYDPAPPDGLGWHPVRTYLASYDAVTLERRTFSLAPNSGVAPIYGYAVSSDASHTYLFGNTFEQNLVREGGLYWTRGTSATKAWLARVPCGWLDATPEYRTADGWSMGPADAVTISERFFVENPMQPRFIGGQWVSTTKVDGYWGDKIAVDVAGNPGVHGTPCATTRSPRGNDPKMNTYRTPTCSHGATGYGSVLISVSNNARNMRRDAWTNPHRYRPMFFHVPYTPTPTTTTTTTTTVPLTTTTSTSTTSTTTEPTTTTTTTSTTVPSTSWRRRPARRVRRRSHRAPTRHRPARRSASNFVGMDDNSRTDAFAEIVNLLAAPIAGAMRSVEQTKRGVDEMWRAVENLNRTLESLNDTAQRVNRLLDEVEGPVKAMIPQLTRTIETADSITRRLDGPIRAAAPNIERIVETLSAPGFARLPSQLTDVLESIGDVSRRLGPLAAFAEGAGGLFGAMRPSAPKPADSRAPPAPPLPTATKVATKKVAVKKVAARKRATKKAAANKRTAKKAAG